jgi:hypothetical protein
MAIMPRGTAGDVRVEPRRAALFVVLTNSLHRSGLICISGSSGLAQVDILLAMIISFRECLEWLKPELHLAIAS